MNIEKLEAGYLMLDIKTFCGR